ncbi:MAG: alpha/beta hydrolase domain-containing protein [Candidatus Aminicenantales bacterium]
MIKLISRQNIRIPVLFLAFLIGGMALGPKVATAKVVKVEMNHREVVSTSLEHSRSGSYEVIKGIIYLEVDPDDPANQLIVDLRLAPRNSRGNVEFSTEFELHKPVNADRGNHRLLYFVNNRGNKLGNWHFNHQAGKNWLYSQGWSYLWCGWNCDVIESDQTLNIKVPVATEKGKTITGKIYAEMISYANNITYSQPIVWGGSIAYPLVDRNQSQASLTMRQYRWDEPIDIPRDQWEFARLENGQTVPDPGFVYIKQGFKPGWLYDLVYVGKDSKVTGLGLAAIRDVVSFFKYEKADEKGQENPLADMIAYAYAWGHSQSARLLNHFIYQDFNSDEKQRMVFDGLMANCPGAGKGLFNSRFAQTTRHGSHHEDNLFPIDLFPFSTVEQYDPVTGERGDGLARARKSGFLPKMFFINSSTDYWTRAASLLHTDVEGKNDSAIDPNVRIYSIAGRAHTESRIGIIGRSLLVALDQWVSHGVEPPASQIPKISNRTLVDMETFRKTFPDIPGVLMPDSFYNPYRLNMGARWQTKGIADNVPPKTGPRYVCLIPQVDEDGNEIAGIRLPEISVPLATFTGWSMRSPLYSRTLRRNAGRVWPFPISAEERKKKGDSRKSILERYPDKTHYLSEVTKSLLNLRHQRFLLDEDVSMLLKEAAEQNYWPIDENATLVSIKTAATQTPVVKRGESAILTVRFEGLPGDIISVKAVVREAPQNFYVFNDNGQDEDELAGDNVWTGRLDVVSDAVPGEYHLDIQAFDKNWNPIFLFGTIKEGRGEIGSIIITVK